MSLKEALHNDILVADGAMGTLLYSYGVDRCFEELNLSHPEQVVNVHQAYIDAGASVIQTNTYGANYPKLARYGLEDNFFAINTEAVRLAKKAAGDQAFILGTIGGIRGIKKDSATIKEIKRSFREQLFCLLLEGVDGILLETYYDLEELLTVLDIVKGETNVPVIANVSIHEPGILQNGLPLGKGFNLLEERGADVLGLNCRLGPYHMIRSLEGIELPKHAYLSSYPNASLPEYENGRLVYESDPNYFKESAKHLREQGARLIGGCCGTTPKHIAAIADGLSGLKPVTEKRVLKVKESTEAVNDRRRPEPHLHDIVKERPSVIVELDPPKKLKTEKFLKGAKALKEQGVDALTLADNSLASPRICNMAMASVIKNNYSLRPLVHLTCRDRNLIGLQSHLLGLHELGINQVLALTGDPTKVGDFPGATSVYDLSSLELIRLIKQLNAGLSFSGQSLGEKTQFSVAGAFNPNVYHLNKSVKRLERKIRSGADYFISQPVYSEKQLVEIYDHVKHIKHPVYIGIMPLVNSRNAEFLHNEVPGIKLSDEVRERMASCGNDRQKGEREGIAIAKSLIETALDLFNGIYLITPFLRYEITVELTQFINERTQLLTKNSAKENQLFV